MTKTDMTDTGPYSLHSKYNGTIIHIHHIKGTLVSETWLDGLPHYDLHIFRRDRNHRGGDVAIIFSNRVRYHRCSDLSEGSVE